MPHAPWRTAWAERENERRRRAYRDAADAWQRRDDHLARLRIEAASFLGCTQPRAGLPVDLADDELVFRVLPAATLVEAEARHVPGLPAPDGSGAFAAAFSDALPPGLRAVDTGLAVVTSHRVAFAGRARRREWRYADLVGPAHHPDVPVTLLPDHSRLGGLLVPTSAVVNFRFYLTLAVAADRAAVLAQVDAVVAAHRNARPVACSFVRPDDAPLTAVRPDRRALGAAAVAAVVFATVGPGALGPRPAGPDLPEPVHRAEIVALDVPMAAPVALPPVGPVAPRPRTGLIERAPSAARPAVPVSGPVVSAAVEPTVLLDPSPAATPPRAPHPSAGPTPDPVPSSLPTPSVAPPPTPPAPTSSAPTSSAPTSSAPTATPSPDAGLLAVCLDPLQLPVLCPSPTH
ncbi:hypothetical protein O7634_15080 [Micromonospora sp. WMMD1120]|uniref:hypothetical protein n=1 Tax=Micromonospora sp. WMMD1120 TaxID=3016106 RepID=UPI002415B9E8|nr:hypothetical protein [Micromonospora sp. WMMD1120]MDG4808077.1 hypothetical protein [Micromonospora sp. WMMD1120]